MVLDLKTPSGPLLSDLLPLRYVALCYLLSFVYLAIYWNNHHHLFHAVHEANGLILWANIHLLFWLSLIPFVTAWAGENNFAPWPTGLYGVVLFMAAIAYFILVGEVTVWQGHTQEQVKQMKESLAELKKKGATVIAKLLDTVQ